MINFNRKLIVWYSTNKRDLPWKENNNPYQIWLSEIILQQTQVKQGLPYYLKFIKIYPTVTDLANAPIDDILKLWEGLGYYSRARNLHIAAQTIRDKFNGIFPKTYQDIRHLKGIGDYTAAAIASFAYNQAYAVVDGNVFRVLSRIFGIEIPIDTTEGKKYFQNKAQVLLDKKNPAIFNQAIMDFGSLICTPKQPKCNNCPFSSECVAYNNDTISKFPIKSKKLIKKTRYLHYFVASNGKQIIIRQRSKNDIWKLLHDFPCIETSTEILSRNETLSLLKIKKLPKPHQLRQVLTHQVIIANFYEVNFEDITPNQQYKTITSKELKKIGFPKIILNYFQNRLVYLT